MRHTPLLGPEPGEHRSGQDRMAEAQPLAVDLEHARAHRAIDGPFETLGAARRPQRRQRRVEQRGRQGEHPLHRLREGLEPLLDQRLQAVRHRQRLGRGGVDAAPLQGPAELAGVQRVAARGGVDPAQERPRQRPADALAQHLVERPQPQRAEVQRVQAVRVEAERRRAAAAPGQQQADGLAVEPAQREGQGLGARGVEPGDVVHGQEERAGAPQHGQDAGGQGPLVCSPHSAALERQRRLQRRALRRGQRVERGRQQRLEQVPEPGVRKPRLGRRRPRREHQPGGRLEGVAPDRGLADPGVSLQQDGAAAFEHAGDPRELLLPADGCHGRSLAEGLRRRDAP